MAWVKIPHEHHAVFEAALPDDDRIETKKMFGGLAAMLNGQMMAGLFGTTAMVKLSPADCASLARVGGTPFDPMGNGRTMAGTLLLPQPEFEDRARLAGWLRRSRDHVASLPAKAAPKMKRRPSDATPRAKPVRKPSPRAPKR